MSTSLACCSGLNVLDFHVDKIQHTLEKENK